MILIQIDALATSTTLSSTSSTIDDTVDNEDLSSTSITGLITSMSLLGNHRVDIQVASRYIDSLSDTQLVQMEEMLNEKEDMFAQIEYSPVEGKPKVFQKINKV